MADTSSGSRSIWRLEAPRAGAPPGRARLRAAARGLTSHDLVQSGGRSARPGASAPGDPSRYRPRDLPPTRGPVAARPTLRSTTGPGDLTQSQCRVDAVRASSAVAVAVSERGCAGPRPRATRVGPSVCNSAGCPRPPRGSCPVCGSPLRPGRLELGIRGAPRRCDRLAPIRAASAARIWWPPLSEVVGELNGGTSMWETVSTNQRLLMVPSHSSHEIRFIRRNRTHYLSIFRRPRPEAAARTHARFPTPRLLRIDKETRPGPMRTSAVRRSGSAAGGRSPSMEGAA